MAHKIGDIFDGDRARRKQQQAQNAAMSAEQARADMGNRRDLATNLLNRGKGTIFDVTDSGKVGEFLDSMEGEYLDPFPDYLREAGDRLIEGIEGTASALPDFIGDARSRMEEFFPEYKKLEDANASAIDRLSSIYDGRLESDLTGFANELQDINTENAALRHNLGQEYADSLADSINTRVDLANKEFDVRGVGARATAAAERAAATRMAQGAQRNVNSMRGAGTGTNMLTAMLGADLGQRQAGALADSMIENESGRFNKLGEINPALADVYRNEARLSLGDPRLGARAENIGIQQGLLESIMGQQLSNTNMIPGLGMQGAGLSALMGEAGLSGDGPLARNVSSYTSTGTLPQGQTVFNPTPYTPAPSMNMFDHLARAPEYARGVKSVAGSLGKLFS